jgi:hypothetical protein
MITLYLARTAPLPALYTNAMQAPEELPVRITAVREILQRALTEIAARDEKIVELENRINLLKGERDDL